MRANEFITELLDAPAPWKQTLATANRRQYEWAIGEHNYYLFAEDMAEGVWELSFSLANPNYDNDVDDKPNLFIATNTGNELQVFATVIDIIMNDFIPDVDPDRIYFEADKTQLGNPTGRASLYARLIKRYMLPNYELQSGSSSDTVAFTITKSRAMSESLVTESKNHPVIVVDVQPEYSGMNDGDESAVFPEIINFVHEQTGPVLMFVNAEDTGASGDTIDDVRYYWEDTIRGEDNIEDSEDDDEYYEPEDLINWNRFTIVDKGYGYLRSWMDAGVDESIIIKVIREMYQQNVYDSRELFDGDESETYAADMETLMGAGHVDEATNGNNITVGWTSVAQLKKFNGAYIVGGGRHECLREVELLMNAFNVKYKRIDSLVYG